MGKIVLILILVFVVAYALRRALGARSREDEADNPAPRGARQSAPERMLSCQHCKALTPMSAGVVRGGRFYCTDAHARLAQDA
ncbi:MAG TPA: PP0621 family protein [Burkholderiaceae bacterium]|nr:PP0621 family protein [Burkholderiaceae bacterium]